MDGFVIFFGQMILLFIILLAIVWALSPPEIPRASREEAERRFRESGPDYGE